MSEKNPFELDMVSIRLVKEAPLISDVKIDSPQEAVQVLGNMVREMDREVGCVINLRTDKSPINCSIVSMGTLNAALMHPREILKSSILSNAQSIILLHNHPSGNLKPSRDDIILTDKMIKVCSMVDIPLLDHIIVGSDMEQYFSFRENSMIYVPQINYEEDITKLNFGNPNTVSEAINTYHTDNERNYMDNKKSDLKYFVAECMEFPNMGSIYDDISSIEEAIKIYEQIPEERRNLGRGIGVVVDGANYPLLEQETCDILELYEELRDNLDIISAVHKVNEYLIGPVKANKDMEINENKVIIEEKSLEQNSINNTKNKEKEESMETNINKETSQQTAQEERKQQLLQKLEDGIKNTLDSEEFAKWCVAQSKLYYNKYSATNAMLAFFQKPDVSYMQSYDQWQQDGRQVKKGATGIKIFAPVFIKDFGDKGSFFASVRKHCNESLKKNTSLEYASYIVSAANLEFIMYRNGLFDVKFNNKVKMAHVTPEETRKFVDRYIVGKVPRTYNVVNVFDISDTIDVDYVWLKKGFKKDELALDDKGKAIRNPKGYYKVINTDERKASFDVKLDMIIPENDTKKMEILYDILKKISSDKGIPVIENSRSDDDNLTSGALGYYDRVTNIIALRDDLDITNKVAVLLHEITHSDLHRDLGELKEEIRKDSNEDIVITRELKEMQAEAVAYSVGSAFGLDTEHKSFGYIAHWSEGRELKSLQQSLNVIYKECGKLMSSIEQELSERGLNMQLEEEVKVYTKDEVQNIVADYKKFVLDETRTNDSLRKSAVSELNAMHNEDIKVIMKEQIVLMTKIDETLNTMNQNLDKLQKVSDLQEQKDLIIQSAQAMAQVMMFKEKIENLNVELINVMRDIEKQEKKAMQDLYFLEPMKLMEHLKEEFSQLKDLSDTDLKYMATSPFIRMEYGKFIGSDNEKWVAGALAQLGNFKQVLSKNSTAVEISTCEAWTKEPIFVRGAVMHPKLANTIVHQAEEQIRELKVIAEQKGDYFPYSKCKFSIFTLDDNKNLISVGSRVDIGDGYQKDLLTYVNQLYEAALTDDFYTEKNIAELEVAKNNLTKACRERTNIKMLTPEQATPVVIRKENVFNGKSLESWKADIKAHMNEKINSNEQEKKQDKELGEELDTSDTQVLDYPFEEIELERG